MPNSVSRPSKRMLSALTAFGLAASLSFSAATPARAADPVVVGVVAGLIAIAAFSQNKPKYTPKYTVIAQYCENPKTGLYYKC